MLEVSEKDIGTRLSRDNPWWSEAAYQSPAAPWPRRIYFDPFFELATDRTVRRATVLMGPRRVGKTVMLHQLVDKLLRSGEAAARILYVSIDTPIYSHMPLEKFLDYFDEHPANGKENYFVLFDEIQYLKNWEQHLKDLVDRYHNIKFVASGSAAAALRLASTESGAGRFSDFSLPPLTFAEYIEFIGRTDELVEFVHEEGIYREKDIVELNVEFVNYINYGGYPEAVLSPTVRENADQFVRSDIIDKVLLKDLPALYGITDIQELNRLFSHLAYNTGQELSLQTLSEKSAMSKPTISRYIEYLESAFLISKVSRIDANAKKFQRETHFKAYLTNPSMRAALFSPTEPSDSEVIGHLAESAIFSQWSHRGRSALFYARWPAGEIDMVRLSGANLRPDWAVEIKWSNRAVAKSATELKGLSHFLERKTLSHAVFTTLDKTGVIHLSGCEVKYMPTSVYCYSVGKNVSTSNIQSFKSG
ncbi:ATP-binding protein [Pararhodobacter oceanensis]|uniref:ATP-binding protein n=1 Tax=Pararhodobacter oceanensis TaxID=2172121 RepID=UPI003A958CF2